MSNSMAIPNADINDFVSKVDEVTALIEGMKNGTIAPDEITLPGESKEDAEERIKEEKRRAKRVAMNEKQRLEDLRLERIEERERWWELFDMTRRTHESDDEGAENKKENPDEPAKRRRNRLDYSFWDKWVQNPDDPVTAAERKAQEELQEKANNEEFEKNNPEFVTQFKKDMEERKKNNAKKAKDAEALKARGNKLFQDGHLDQAERRYHEALKKTPFNIPILTNLAAVHTKLKQWDDAEDFCKRALAIDEHNVKALYRQAVIHRELDRIQDAVECLEVAHREEPGNTTVAKFLRKCQSQAEEKEALAAIARRRGGSEPAPAPTPPAGATAGSGAPPSAGAAAPPPLPGSTRVVVEELDDDDDNDGDASAGSGAGSGAGAGAASSGGVAEPAVKSGGGSTTDVYSRLDAFAATLAAVADAAQAGAEGGTPAAPCSVSELRAELEFLVSLEDSAPETLVYVRSCGVLSGVCRGLVRGRARCSAASSDEDFGDGDSEGVTAESSGDLFVDAGVQQMAILALLALYNNTHNESVVRSSGTLKCIMETATEDREAYQQACAAAFAFLERAAKQPSTRQRVCGNKDVLVRAMNLLHSLGDALHGTGHLKPLELEAAAKAAALVQGCALEQRTAAMISANAALGNMMPALFRVVAGVVSRVQSSGRMRLGGATVAETLLGSDVLQAVCGALANLAHYPALRPTFVVDTRSDPTAEGGTVPALVSLVDVLQLKVPATSADAAAALVTVRGSVLAALSNAGLDNTQVLHELCRAGAVATLLKLLKKPATPVVLLDRGSALLARLSSHPTVLQYMKNHKVLARIATVFCAPHCASPAFRRHLVRCIAASMDTPALVMVVDKVGGVDRLVEVLWEIVSQGQWHNEALIVGNLVKCIIACTRHEPCLAKLAAVDVIPPLVEVVKGGDASKAATESVARSLKVARKNAAIALARMAAHPRAKQRMDELQAMKILIQLQGEIA